MSAIGIVLVVVSLVVVVGSSIVYQLILQSGRLLLRVEELEARLTEKGILTGKEKETPEGLPAGSVVHDFELPVLGGGRMTLSQWRGRRVLLVFLSPDCAYCRQMLPDLVNLLSSGYESLPVTLVISTGDPEENRKLFQDSGIFCPVLLQEQMEVAILYQVAGTPAAYLIDERGVTAAAAALGSHSVLALARCSSSRSGTEGEAPHDSGITDSPRITPSLAKSRIVRDGLKVGTPAPGFQLQQLDGSRISLEDYHGRKVLLVFSDPVCEPCNRLAPRLERLHRRSKDIQVLMISRGGPEANRKKAAEYGLTFPIALQNRWEISRAYGIFATPIAYLIDEMGVIVSDVAVGSEAILGLYSKRRNLLETVPARS